MSKKITFFLILVYCLSSFAVGADQPAVKVFCPYDDFGEEEMFYELKDGKVSGELLSPYLYYEIQVNEPKTDIQYNTNGTLKSFYFEGMNKDNEFLSFTFNADEYGEGIGETKSKVIGNRVFICNQSL